MPPKETQTRPSQAASYLPRRNAFPPLASFDGQRLVATHAPVDVVEGENGSLTIMERPASSREWMGFSIFFVLRDNQFIIIQERQSMENPTPDELDTLLQELSGSFLPGKRKYAAQSLGQLITSSAEIVQALAAAVAVDSDPEVRSAAALALQSPVHQDFIKNNPDLMQQAVESAIRGRQQEQHAADQEIVEEFQRRLSREKRAYLLFFVTIFALFGSFTLLLVLDVDFRTMDCILRIVQFAVIAAAVIFAWRSWRKYRCPSCGSWLSGWKAGINVFFASSPLRCPHCGVRLL